MLAHTWRCQVLLARNKTAGANRQYTAVSKRQDLAPDGKRTSALVDRICNAVWVPIALA
jgi:hypothetical protein